MKHVSYGEKSLLMTDESADALIAYAAALGAENDADTVTLSAIGPEGNEVDVTFLLNPATTLVIETATGKGEPPDNEFAVLYMRERTQRLRQPPPAQPQVFDDELPGGVGDDLRGLD